MPQKEGNELERILAELNSNMKKESEKEPPAAKAEEPSKPETEEQPAKEKAEPKKKQAPRKNARSDPKKKEPPAQALEEKLEQTAAAAAGFVEEERRSFAETARIIEEDVGDREEIPPAVRHIAVASVVEVTEEEKGESAPRRPIDPLREEPPQGRAPVARKRRRKMSRREKTTAVLGLVVTFFVVIGLISSIVAVVNFTRGLVNSTAKKEEFAQVIFPLVIVDVPEFESPTALDNSAIVSSAIWAFVVDDTDKSKYQKDDLGSLVVPDVDVEYYIRKLYGSEVPIQHQSVEDASISMVYDAERKAYIIESTPKYLPYTPRVDKIVREGELYTLTVSYILPDAMWNMNRGDRPYTVDKVMEYRLKKVEDNYQILSVKLLEVTGATTSDLTDGPIVGMDPEEEPISEPDADGDTGDGENADTASGEGAASGEQTSSAGEPSSAAA